MPPACGRLVIAHQIYLQCKNVLIVAEMVLWLNVVTPLNPRVISLPRSDDTSEQVGNKQSRKWSFM